MYQPTITQRTEVKDRMDVLSTFQVAVKIQPESKISQTLAELAPEIPRCERKQAARKLGCMRSSEALPGLLDALVGDPFWMVRCTIIQALEMICIPEAIPALCYVAEYDTFQVVRSHAAIAVERLS